MHHQISKKIFIYFLILFFLGTINNLSINKFNFPKIKNIKITGLEDNHNLDLLKELNIINQKNIFFLNKNKIRDTINSNNLVERYYIFRKYPSSLEIKIDKAKFLANTIIEENIFFLGSNGKLIQSKSPDINLPFLFGNPSSDEFFRFKKKIDESRFEYENVNKIFFFPSKRWDVEIKDGILIKLPKVNQDKALNLSFDILSSDNFENVKTIDARVKNQIILTNDR